MIVLRLPDIESVLNKEQICQYLFCSACNVEFHVNICLTFERLLCVHVQQIVKYNLSMHKGELIVFKGLFSTVTIFF
jgi:hypothetical protein